MGRPGCGKGTQIELLLQKFPEYETLHLGQIFRDMAAEPTFLGQKIKTGLDAGYLMPHWLASYFFKNKVLHLAPERGVLFEGSARKVAEAEDVDEVLTWMERSYRIILLDVPKETIMERLRGRRESEDRADDRARSIELRLEEYEKYTVPAIQFFKDKNLLIEIDGSQPIDAVHADIVASVTALP